MKDLQKKILWLIDQVNKLKRAGCNDGCEITIPEKCIVWTGEDLVCNETTLAKAGDRMDVVQQNIVNLFCDCERCQNSEPVIGGIQLVAVRSDVGEKFFGSIPSNNYLSSDSNYATQLENVTYVVDAGPGLYEIENITYFFGDPDTSIIHADIKLVLRVNGIALEVPFPNPNPNTSLIYYTDQIARISGNNSPMTFKFYAMLNQGDEVFVDYKKQGDILMEFGIDGIKTIVKKVNQI